MLWKIEKSLGNVAAVQVDSVPESGVCVEVKNFQQPDTSVLIYKDGKLEDLTINDYTFSYVYNQIYPHGISQYLTFCYLNPSGEHQEFLHGNISLSTESIFVEWFYSMLHYISYCDNIEQFRSLCTLIIDRDSSWIFITSKRREIALRILNFIEEFTPRLSKVKDTTYLQGLKQKLNTRFKEAQEVISKSECPE